MTTGKDFKRHVRGRMRKTGESYTTARAQLINQRNGKTPDVAVASSPPVQPSAAEFERLAGTADATIKARTGCTWDRWVWALDQVNAHAWPHKEIAEFVHEKYKVPGWWAQAVTVGYERIKGLRAIGQRRSGSWEASKSTTIDAAAGKIFQAIKQPAQRARWLNGAKAVVRTATPNKSVRMTWEDGSSVETYIVSKGRSKTTVTVQHTKLKDREAVDRQKAFWTERLAALSALVAAPAAATRPARGRTASRAKAAAPAG
jgi:uncharacterized protein YndB with AHSA1/START domain